MPNTEGRGSEAIRMYRRGSGRGPRRSRPRPPPGGKRGSPGLRSAGGAQREAPPLQASRGSKVVKVAAPNVLKKTGYGKGSCQRSVVPRSASLLATVHNSSSSWSPRHYSGIFTAAPPQSCIHDCAPGSPPRASRLPPRRRDSGQLGCAQGIAGSGDVLCLYMAAKAARREGSSVAPAFSGMPGKLKAAYPRPFGSLQTLVPALTLAFCSLNQARRAAGGGRGILDRWEEGLPAPIYQWEQLATWRVVRFALQVTRPPALEATQGQIDGFFNQLPYKCHQN